MTFHLYTPAAVQVGTVDGPTIIDAAHNVAVGLGFDVHGQAPRLDAYQDEHDQPVIVEVYERHDGGLVAQIIATGYET